MDNLDLACIVEDRCAIVSKCLEPHAKPEKMKIQLMKKTNSDIFHSTNDLRFDPDDLECVLRLWIARCW